MEFQTLKGSRNKKIVIGVIIFITIINMVMFGISHASYRTTQSINIAHGIINYSPGDLNILAIKIQQEENNTEENNYESDTDIPTGSYKLNTKKSYCAYKENDVEQEVIATMVYDSTNGIVNINIDISKKGTKCYLYFDIKTSPLPDGYTELEYIEKTDINTYINTGLSGGYAIETSVMPTKLNAVNQDIAGATLNNSPWNSNILRWSNAGNNRSLWEVREYNKAGPQFLVGTKYDIVAGIFSPRVYITVNGTSIFDVNSSATIMSYNIYLFASNYAGSINTSTAFVGKMWRTKFYSDANRTNLVRDFIPAKHNSDNMVGMYDLVSNAMFANAGGQTFTAGPEV